MINNLKMTVLIDNIASEPLCAEWGLSIFIEADNNKILLDTGASELFAQNAQLLNISLEDINFAVLSHAHYDHADGMETFFSKNQSAPFLLSHRCYENCYGLKEGELHYIGIKPGIMEEYAKRIKYINGAAKISDGIWLVPHRKADYSSFAVSNDLYISDGNCHIPDDFGHEQSLVFETEKGLVVFNSCSHTGMINILADIEEMLGRNDVYAYIGGLHLFKRSGEEVSELGKEIAATGIQRIFTGHCTGEQAFGILKAELGNRLYQIHSGFSVELS